MKRMSNLFASDQSRRPASASLRAPAETPTWQQRQHTGQWLQGNAVSYDSTLFHISQPTVTGTLGCEISASSQQQQEQAWMSNGLDVPSVAAIRPSPPARAFTADDRPAHILTDSPTLGHSTLAFPQDRPNASAQQARLAFPSRPSSVQSHVSGKATGQGFPATSRPITPSEGRTIERVDLHKLLKSIEGLLISFDEYRSLQAQLSKVEKHLEIGCADLAKNKTVGHNPSTALALAGNIFAAQHEVSGRYAKLVQKEYDALNEACAKYFKTIAKEEKTLDDFATVTEDKIKKAQAAYERGARKGTTNARAMADAHEKYISTISALASATTVARNTHATVMAGKSHAVSLRVASTLGGIAESSFRAYCDSVRATGVTVGPLAAARNFCSSEAMPSQPPVQLAEDERGPASMLAEAARSHLQESVRREVAVHVGRPRTEAWGNVADSSARTSAPPSPAWNFPSSQDHTVRRPPSYHSMTGAQTSRSSSSDGNQLASPSSAPQQRRNGLPVPPQPQLARRAPSPMSSARQLALEHTILQSRNQHDEPAEVRSEASSVAPSSVIEPQSPVAATEGQYEPSHDRPSPKPLRSVGDIPTLPRSTLPPALDRRRSLWEQEREQQESRDREAVLERRARDAEDRLRFLEQATSPSPSHQKLAAAGLVSCPGPTGPQDYFTLQTEEERHQLEPNHRSPAISRSSSSGTTASEMSFVARMKSRYQLEKESERSTALRTEQQQQDERHRVMPPTSQSRPTQAGPDPRAGDGTLPRPRLPPTLSSPAPVRPFSSNFPRPGNRQLYGVRSTSYQTTLAATAHKPAPRRDEEGPYGNFSQKIQSDAREELLAQEDFERAFVVAAGGEKRSRVTFRRGSPSIVQ